jgi:acetyl esterase/lipase
MRRLLLFAVLTSLAVSLRAETRVWTGAANDLWTNPANWGVGGAPVAGDRLEFESGSNATNFNDYPAGTSFHSIAALNLAWTFNGNAVTVTNGIGAYRSTFNLPITVGGPQLWTSLCCEQVTFNGAIDLNGNALELRGAPIIGGNGGRLTVTGPIAGAGSVNATGRFVTLSGDNTYTGITYATDLTVSSDSGLGAGDGTAANGTVIIQRLVIDDADVGNEAIEISDFGQLHTIGNVTFGPLTTKVEPTFTIGAGGHVTLIGPLLATHPLEIGAFAPGATLTLNHSGSSADRLDLGALLTTIVGMDNALPANAQLVVAGTLDLNDRTAAVRLFEMMEDATFAAGAQPLIVAQSVKLLGELTLTDSFDGTTGTSYTIIRNDSSGPVIGQFENLPEGGSFTLRGQTYVITYTGNDGNDVVLHAGSPPPAPSEVFIDNTSIVETNGDVTFHVTLSTAATSTVTVQYATANATATAGSDYAGTSGTLTFLAGETEKTIVVTILEDMVAEGEETFVVRLGDVTGNATIRDGQGIATIVDDDVAFTTTTHEYARIGNRALLLDLSVPVTATPPYPVIVWLHAGQWRAGSRTPNPAVREVARGYAVAAIDYRLSGEAKFPAQIADAKAAVRWLRAHATQLQLDPQRIGAWGHGAGAHLAALLGTAGFAFDDPAHGNAQFSSRVRAVVAWGAPTNLLRMNATALPCGTIDHNAPDSPESLLLGCTLPACPEAAAQASPVTWASAGDPPFHIAHGQADCDVSPAQSLELFNALRSAGVDVTLGLFDDVRGPADAYWSTENALAPVDAFFDEKLKNAPILVRRRAARK